MLPPFLPGHLREQWEFPSVTMPLLTLQFKPGDKVFALTPYFVANPTDGELPCVPPSSSIRAWSGVPARLPLHACLCRHLHICCASHPGCYAEYVVAEEGWLARVPDNLPLEQAGGVPLVALTAWQALHKANPQQGQRVLITAASGGVGHMAVQVLFCY
jgi:NADPH:quinone reductase-like Zn-dependent oxidoreductase